MLVGNRDDAVDPPAGVAFIVNAADIDFPWKEDVRRFWVNLNYRGNMGGVAWASRLRSAVLHIIEVLSSGQDVLIHCRGEAPQRLLEHYCADLLAAAC